jgi:hypothetical protein
MNTWRYHCSGIVAARRLVFAFSDCVIAGIVRWFRAAGGGRTSPPQAARTTHATLGLLVCRVARLAVAGCCTGRLVQGNVAVGLRTWRIIFIAWKRHCLVLA